MFISHCDNNFIDCTSVQFDKLLYVSKTLFKIFNKSILEYQILDAMYYDSDIFYSAKYLFNSKKDLNKLYKNYCNLAKLIYLYYNKNYNNLELQSVITGLIDNQIPLDLLYSEYY